MGHRSALLSANMSGKVEIAVPPPKHTHSPSRAESCNISFSSSSRKHHLLLLDSVSTHRLKASHSAKVTLDSSGHILDTSESSPHDGPPGINLLFHSSYSALE